MTRRVGSTPWRIAAPALLALGLGACGAGERLANIGQAPPLTPISNPATEPDYQRIQLPMPTPQVAERGPSSLWQAGSRTFFRDQRAQEIGDILTIVIEIDDSAEISNQTTRSRSSGEGAGLPSLLGFESELNSILPDAVDPSSLIEFSSDSTSEGSGEVQRGESIELQLAALVTDILPNGNLVIYGRQEVRVNFEVRDLEIAGVIRPEDITARNTISYEKIAEARISYGGRGQITDVQQPRYGQQVYDIIFPF